MHKFKLPAIAIAATIMLATLTSCATGLNSTAGDAQSDAAVSGRAAAPESLTTDARTSQDAMTPQDALSSQDVNPKQVITTVSLALEAQKPATVADEIAQIVTAAGGSVESLTISQATEEAAAGADLTLRVPTASLQTTIDQISDAGTVVHETQSAQDITAEYVDTEARVRALETSVKRLSDLMQGAATTSELIEAEMALTQRQQELDGLKAQLDSLKNQVDASTIWVSITAPNVLPGGGPGSFWEGLTAGVSSIAAAAAGALVLLGVLLPWLAIAAVIAAIIAVIVRVRRSRRARKTQPAPASRPEAPTQAQP